MTRDLLELTKKKVFVQCEKGQVMWEEYKFAVERKFQRTKFSRS